MLWYLPVVLTCVAIPSCSAIDIHGEVTRLSPSPVVSSDMLLTDRVRGFTATPSPLRLASQRVRLLLPRVSGEHRTQVGTSRTPGGKATRGMLICAGLVAGLYVGAAKGSGDG